MARTDQPAGTASGAEADGAAEPAPPPAHTPVTDAVGPVWRSTTPATPPVTACSRSTVVVDGVLPPTPAPT